MNRILVYLAGSACPVRRAEEVRARLRIECESIEAVCEECLEFVVPGVATLIDEPEPKVGFFLTVEPECCGPDSDIRAFTVFELRRIASTLMSAAARVEGGAN